MTFHRYAIYYTAPQGALATFGAAWLGWDIATGKSVDHPIVDGLPEPISEITGIPRKYGFHGTIKPPFRLADGKNSDDLINAISALADNLSPVTLPGLELTKLGSFLALTPVGDQTKLIELAAGVVRNLDHFRRPLSDEDLARRRKARLSPRQEQNLLQWGYPYVMQDFRFHLTLTGRLARSDAKQVETALRPTLAPVLPAPFVISDLTLAGEDDTGRFHEIRRFALRG